MKRVGYHRSWEFEGNSSFSCYGEDFDHIFEDRSDTLYSDRPGLEQMLATVKSGDLVIVQSVDRLADSVSELKVITKEVLKKKCILKFREEDILFCNSDEKTYKLFQQLLSSLKNVEQLQKIVECQGLTSKVAQAVFHQTCEDTSPVNVKYLREKRAAGVTIRELQEEFNLSQGAIYRLTAPDVV